MIAIIIQFNARLRRAACPLVGPRLAGALVGVGMHYALLPFNVACAAIGGYAEAQRAVLFPPFAPRGLTATALEINVRQEVEADAELAEV